MRRLLSILIALVLGLGPSISAVPASALASAWSGKANESSLPACCRHNGKHHCAMDTAAQSASGQVSISALDLCPFAPHALASTAPQTAVLVFAVANPAAFHSAATSPRIAPSPIRISDRRSWPRRGPPAPQIL